MCGGDERRAFRVELATELGAAGASHHSWGSIYRLYQLVVTPDSARPTEPRTSTGAEPRHPHGRPSSL